MAKPIAHFPTSVWDGTSANPSRASRLVDAGPTNQDWDQIVSEVVAIEAAAIAGGASSEQSYTKPPLSDTLIAVNQGPATIVDDAKGFFIVAPPVAGNNMRCFVTPLPAAPYTFTIRAIPTVWNGYSHAAGIVLRDSGSGKLLRFGWNSYYVLFDKLSSPTTYVAGYGSENLGSPNVFFPWLRIHDDGTNRTYWMSQDGLYWHLSWTVGRTDYATPDQIGVCAESNDAVREAALRVVSWQLTTP